MIIGLSNNQNQPSDKKNPPSAGFFIYIGNTDKLRSTLCVRWGRDMKDVNYRPNDDDCEVARKLAIMGFSHWKIGFFLEVDADEFYKWCEIDKRFYESVNPSEKDVKKYLKLVEDRKNKKREMKRRLSLNPAYRIENSLRARLHAAASGRTSSTSCFNFTVEELIAHLKSLFKDGMTMDNYGMWHIDHIKPCSMFDHQNKEHVSECWSLKNLQPLWASENLKKGAKYGS